jgi:hypothetical protein
MHSFNDSTMSIFGCENGAQHTSVHITSKCKGNDMPTLTLPLIKCLVKAFKTQPATDARYVNGFVKVLQGVIANS